MISIAPAVFSGCDDAKNNPASTSRSVAAELQRLFADRSQHRALSLVDALVAAVAETRQLILLHYYADFELVSRITGQPTQWIVEPGTTD